MENYQTAACPVPGVTWREMGKEEIVCTVILSIENQTHKVEVPVGRNAAHSECERSCGKEWVTFANGRKNNGEMQ